MTTPDSVTESDNVFSSTSYQATSIFSLTHLSSSSFSSFSSSFSPSSSSSSSSPFSTSFSSSSSSSSSSYTNQAEPWAPSSSPWSSALRTGAGAAGGGGEAAGGGGGHNASLSSSGSAAAAAAAAWAAEVARVERVENVLTPLVVTLIAVSNLTLLLHEARLVWRTQRLIQPKLLVLALSAADLLATLFGYLPLWILFVLPRDSLSSSSSSSSSSSLSSTTSLLSSTTTTTTTAFASLTTTTTTHQGGETPTFFTPPQSSLLLPPPPPTPPPPPLSPHLQASSLYTVGYSVSLFLLTAFWTLAQCIVVVMGVERFIALRAPFFYTARCTSTAFSGVLVLLFLLSCGVGGFQLVTQLAELHPRHHHHSYRDNYYNNDVNNNNNNNNNNNPNNNNNINNNNDDSTNTNTNANHNDILVFAGFLDSRSMAHNVYSLVQGVVWTVVLLACNWAVRRELRRMESRVTVVRMKDQGEYLKQLSMLHGAGREFARFMMAVNVLFLVSSSPNLICVMLRLSGSPPSFSAQFFCWRLSHASALLNPFLYGFLRKSLRSRIRRFLNNNFPCCRSQRVVEQSERDRDRDHPREVRGDQQHAGGPCNPDQLEDAGCSRSPNSAIMPRDPEASLANFSE